MKIYALLYCPHTIEAGYSLVSLHKNEGSALKAKEGHIDLQYQNYVEFCKYVNSEFDSKEVWLESSWQTYEIKLVEVKD